MLITTISNPSGIIENVPSAKIDLTVTISVIIALCAIVSPVLTTIINNCHQTKIKKLELKQQEYRNTIIHQRDFFENYLKHAGRCIYYADSEALKDYGEHYFSALMYAPDDLKADMIEANQLMLKDDWDNASVLIEKLTAKIRAIQQTK